MSKHLYIALTFLLGLISMASWAGKPAANKPPTVSLTSPVNGATFSTPASIVLTANAADSDGTVARVEFYQGTMLVGTAYSSPYTLTWRNVSGGTYSLKAVAIDNAETSTTSATVGITVTGPKILISAPANGSTQYGGSTTVTGTFTGDASTTVLVDNGNSSRLATLSSNIYSATLPLLMGPNTLTVSVARTDKTSDKASVTVTGNDYPKIAFRSPASATFNAPANLLFDVDVVSPGGTIGKVEFYNNGTLASTVYSPPYQYALLNALAKNYTIQAKATDSLGYSSNASTTVTGLGPNTPPTVSLTSPLNGAIYAAPANIAVLANASDPDGSVTLIEIFKNGALLGVSNSSPLNFDWSNIPAGTYTLTAKATDNRAGTTTSAPVSVSVTPPNAPPSVSLTNPATGAAFYAPASIALSANAADSDGTIAKVEFYQGTSLIGTATSAPYAFNWTNVPAGSYSISAKATDNLGSITASAPVNIIVNPNNAPIVSLTSPVAGTSVYAPASLTLSATASDSDGTIAKVEFYQGTTLIGTAANAPYTANWANVAAGTYSITAQATDNLGGLTISAPVSVTVKAFALMFATPTEGAALSGNSVLVSGSFQGPANSGISVNGVVAALDANNNFYATVPLTPGANTITAMLTTLAGTTTTQTMAVSSDGVASAIQISADGAEGIAPYTTNFTIEGATSGNLSYSGGTAVVTYNDNIYTVTYPNPGTYPTTINATDSQGNTVTKSFVIVVQDAAQMDLKFQALWSGMTDSLVAGNRTAAMNYLSAPAQAKYGPVFDVLTPNMAQIVGSFSPPQAGSISPEIGEYAINRIIDGVNQVFFLYFLKGADGIWRLDSM